MVIDKLVSSQKAKARKQWMIENILSFGIACIVVLIIRSSIIEAFKIPSASMVPSLWIGDHIFVNKFAYGLKIPFSDLITDHPIYVIKRQPPKRGDVVVFLYPEDESLHYIKRVIGTPGDTIEVRNKFLYINQKLIKRDLITGDQPTQIFHSLNDVKFNHQTTELYMEHLDAVDHFIFLDRNNFRVENFGPVTVPPESLFVMGDQRDGSHDSRAWGFVPFKNVKGKAVIVWLSLWMGFSEPAFSFHPTRTMHLIR